MNIILISLDLLSHEVSLPKGIIEFTAGDGGFLAEFCDGVEESLDGSIELTTLLLEESDVFSDRVSKLTSLEAGDV